MVKPMPPAYETDPTEMPSSPVLLKWNVVVTAREAGQRRLRRVLRPLVRLHRSGFRNVFVGQIDDLEAFFAAVAELRERRPRLDAWLGKILPIERTFAVEIDRFAAQLEEASAPLLVRLEGHSFHVRVERRGHKGLINTHATERALGEVLYTRLEACGQRPVVAFADPDMVVAVEILGNVCGIGLVTRALRQQFPFVKID